MRMQLLAALCVLSFGACDKPVAPAAETTTASPAEPAPTAAAAQPALAADDGGPPLENGLYAARGACPFEGCTLRLWRVEKQVDLRDAPNNSAAAVTTAPVGEWVKAVEAISFLVPERGVVLKDVEGLKAGDVIYRLEHQGEGTFTVWRRGESLYWTDDGERDDADPNIASGVRWGTAINDMRAKAEANEALGAGWWVRVTRPDGKSGWTRAADNFRCTDELAGDDECEAKQKDAR